jgi:hypothetical protein
MLRFFLALALVLSLVGESFARPATDFLVTPQRIGKARLGMTIKELKRAYPAATFALTEDVTNDIKMKVSGKTRFHLSTRQFWEQIRAGAVRLPRDADEVVSLSTEDTRYQTAASIGVESWLHNAAKIYGKPQLDFWTHGEKAVFPRLSGIEFGVDGPRDQLAGIYSAPQIERLSGKSARFRIGSRISSLGIYNTRFFKGLLSSTSPSNHTALETRVSSRHAHRLTAF